MNKIRIAIDGPAGAGKSSVARRLADRLSYIYIDTGAMYRAVTYHILTNGVSVADEQAVRAKLGQVEIGFTRVDGEQGVMLNGVDVTVPIRTPDVTRNVSQVASYQAVRTLLVEQQQKMAQAGGIVMDGRDIGTAVLPDAELKIFLTASVEERARRRYLETQGTDNEVPYEQLLIDIAARDQADMTRAISPLIQADDAIHVDTTPMNRDEVIEHLYRLAQALLSKEGQA